jgi:hypothetical protein
MPLEEVLAEVVVKGESMIKSMIVDQSEASAIDEAEVFVIISDENHLRRIVSELDRKVFLLNSSDQRETRTVLITTFRWTVVLRMLNFCDFTVPTATSVEVQVISLL